MSRTAMLALASVVCASSPAGATPVLQRAEVHVAFTSPTSCVVSLSSRIAESGEGVATAWRAPVEHRIEETAGARVVLDRLEGAEPVGEPALVGLTRSLTLRPIGGVYAVHYRVNQSAARAFRCPLWVPTVSADGRSLAVEVVVRVPAGATVGGTMPRLTWTGDEGAAVLGHLPAFVHVPFSLPGAPVPWNTPRVMDGIAVVTLLAATLWWATRRGQARLRRI